MSKHLDWIDWVLAICMGFGAGGLFVHHIDEHDAYEQGWRDALNQTWHGQKTVGNWYWTFPPDNAVPNKGSVWTCVKVGESVLSSKPDYCAYEFPDTATKEKKK